jgi:DNA modification methylase
MVTLYHGDCLEILPQIESGSIDAIITGRNAKGVEKEYNYYLIAKEGVDSEAKNNLTTTQKSDILNI